MSDHVLTHEEAVLLSLERLPFDKFRPA